MANRVKQKQKSQRRAQIIMAVFAILVVLSMLASSIWVFSPPTPATTEPQPQSTTIFITPAP